MSQRPVFPRSAVKALQALPLIESGAAERYGLGEPRSPSPAPRIAGEPRHAAGGGDARKAGLDGDALECGTQWPLGEAASAPCRAGRQPSALHNNCSGKHAGFRLSRLRPSAAMATGMPARRSGASR